VRAFSRHHLIRELWHYAGCPVPVWRASQKPLLDHFLIADQTGITPFVYRSPFIVVDPANFPQVDFGITSRLAGRKPPMIQCPPFG